MVARGRKKERERDKNEEGEERAGGEVRGGKREKGPMRGRRRQINVRLMLLSTHSAAELRILDSGAGLSAQTRRISAEIFPVHPLPLPRQAFPQPPLPL